MLLKFYSRDLQMFVISQSVFIIIYFVMSYSVCPGRPLQPSLIFLAKAGNLVLHSGGLWLYSQTSGWAGKVCKGKTLQITLNCQSLIKVFWIKFTHTFSEARPFYKHNHYLLHCYEMIQLTKNSTIFYHVQLALFFIEIDAEILLAHYTWKVAFINLSHKQSIQVKL